MVEPRGIEPSLLMAAFDPLRTLSAAAIYRRVNHGRVTILALGTALLGSCDHFHEYRVLAVAINGRLAFIVDPASSDQETCVEGVDVSTDKGERARAKSAPGDDEQLVANGVFWWKHLERDCDDHFPLFYGQQLKGRRLVYTVSVPGARAGDASSVVEAKPLHVGVVYEVHTSSGMLRDGTGWFRIAPEGHIENWPSDPTPAILNAKGRRERPLQAASAAGSYCPLTTQNGH